MSKKCPYIWLIALTIIPTIVLYIDTINQPSWYPLVRSFVSTLEFTPTLTRMFINSDKLINLLTNTFFYTGPFVSALIAVPIGAACWRAMSWGRPIVRFLCCLVWAAGMGTLCIYLMYHFFVTGGLLFQQAAKGILMLWVACGLVWLALAHLGRGGRPGRLLVVFTLTVVALLVVSSLTMEHWPAFLRVQIPQDEPLFGMVQLFLAWNPFGLCLMLLPAGAACWRAMSWGRPVPRFLCFLLWAAALTVFCVCLFFGSALRLPSVLVTCIPLVFTACLSGGLLWLMLKHTERG